MKVKSVVPILNVSNLQESFAWFAKLGWQKAWEWGTPPNFGGVGADEFEIYLCENAQGGRGRSASRTTGGPQGDQTGDKGVWFAIRVHDVDEMHRRCLAQRLEITWPPTDMPWHLREMHVRHPDGHVIRIGQNIG